MKKVISTNDYLYSIGDNGDALSVEKLNGIYVSTRYMFVADDDMMITIAGVEKPFEVKKGQVVFILRKKDPEVISFESEPLANYIKDCIKQVEENKDSNVDSISNGCF